MSTSVNVRTHANANKYNPRTALPGWLGTVAFCVFFSFVYAQFSHGVHSPFMTFLATIPFAGAIVEYAAWRLGIDSHWARGLFRCGVATLAVASCLRGVFEIAGTASVYLFAYVAVGAALLLASAVVALRSKHAEHSQA